MILEKKFDTGEAVLSYGEGPDNGPPLIILHGVSGYWRYYSPIIRATENNWHIFGINQRGHSDSGKTPGHYFIKEYASDASKFIEENLDEPPVIFGHSLGGMVATIVAGTMKDKVRAIIVGDSLLNIDSRRSFERINKNTALRNAFEKIYKLTSNKSTHLEMASRYSGGIISAGSRLYSKHLLGLDPETMGVNIEAFSSYDSYLKVHDGYDCARLYKEMSCPVCLIQSDSAQGGILTDDDVSYISGVHPDTCVIRLSGLGHDMGLDTGQLDWVDGPLTAFLNSLF